MKEFVLSDRYRLELKWESASYDINGVCKLRGAIFSGPALAEAQKLNEEDHILLDFFQQYIHLVRSVYVAKLSWKGVEYKGSGVVELKEALIEHASELNRVPKLKNNDYLVIDTSNHTVENHAQNLVYKTYVLSTDKELYKFGGN
jgi:hypothetical protein